VTVLVALFCLPGDAVVADAAVAAAVVVVGALAMAPSMAFSTPLAASSFCVRRVFLESLSLGSSSGIVVDEVGLVCVTLMVVGFKVVSDWEDGPPVMSVVEGFKVVSSTVTVNSIGTVV